MWERGALVGLHISYNIPDPWIIHTSYLHVVYKEARYLFGVRGLEQTWLIKVLYPPDITLPRQRLVHGSQLATAMGVYQL